MAARNLITLTLPQWSIGNGSNTTLFTLKLTDPSGNAISNAWANPGVISNDPQFGWLFSNTSTSIILRGASNRYIPLGTPGNVYQLKDTQVDPVTSNVTTYYFQLVVEKPVFTASGNTAGTYYQQNPALTSNEQITITAPSSTSARLTGASNYTSKFSDFFSDASSIPRTISGTFNSNVYWAPALPLGLSFNTFDISGSPLTPTGSIRIFGTPSSLRPAASTYTYYASTSDGRQLSYAQSFTILPPRYLFTGSNLSNTTVTGLTGTVSPVNSASITLTQNVSNAFVVTADSAVNSIRVVGTLPDGLNFTPTSSNITFSGSLTTFLDVSRSVVVAFSNSNSNFNYTTSLTLNFTMTPAMELSALPMAPYKNVPGQYFLTGTAVSHPVSNAEPLQWSFSNVSGSSQCNLSQGSNFITGQDAESNVILDLSFNPNTGAFYGNPGPSNLDASLTVVDRTRTKTVGIAVTPIDDEVTIVRPFRDADGNLALTLQQSAASEFIVSATFRSATASFSKDASWNLTPATNRPLSQNIVSNAPVSNIFRPSGSSFSNGSAVTITAFSDTSLSAQVATLTVRTPENVDEAFNINYSCIPDSIQQAGRLVDTTPTNPFLVLQGRPVEQDQSLADRTVTGTAASRTAIIEQLTTQQSNGTFNGAFASNTFSNPVNTSNYSGLSFNFDGALIGTPSNVGDQAFQVQGRTIGGFTDPIETAPKVYLRVLEDRALFTSPSSFDFVLDYNASQTVTLNAATFSGLPITTQSVSGVPTGVSISVSGNVLTLQASNTTLIGSAFTIRADTSGSQVQKTATVTVNDPSATVTAYTFPAVPTTLFFENASTTQTVTTTPASTVTFDTDTDPVVTLDQNILSLPSPSSVYQPPTFGVLQAGTTDYRQMPLRVANRRITFNTTATSQNWIQQVDVGALSFTANQPGANPLQQAITDVPEGFTWNPFTAELKGAPRRLTMGDSFFVQASDGDTVAILEVKQSVKLPTFLRAFVSPSSQTNFVRNRAIVNAAVHAIDSNAVLPDPLIAFQTGPYPPDVMKEQFCQIIRR